MSIKSHARKKAYELAWTDIELETKYVRITPAKGSNPRRLRISDKLIAMLSKPPRKNAYVFGGGHVEDFSTRFRKQKKGLLRSWETTTYFASRAR